MGLISIILIWGFKTYLLPEVISFNITLFETFIYQFEIPNIILASVLGLFARLSLKGIIEAFFEDFSLKQPLDSSGVSSDSSGVGKSILFKDNGEGSSSQDPTKGGGWAPKKGGVIGPEDFTYGSDTESESSHSMNEDSNATGDNVETFEKKVENMTSKDSVSSIKEKMKKALETYKESGSNVPAFQQQVAEIEKKIEICDSKISELEREERTKGKGKEKEVRNVYDRVIGPGDPDFPRTIENPNYQAPPGGRRKKENLNLQPEVVKNYLRGLSPVAEEPSQVRKKLKRDHDPDYAENSDEEAEAVRRAIEESKKTKSDREDSSSKSGKGR